MSFSMSLKIARILDNKILDCVTGSVSLFKLIVVDPNHKRHSMILEWAKMGYIMGKVLITIIIIIVDQTINCRPHKL